MNVTETDQVVLSPDDRGFIERVKELTKGLPDPSLWTAFKLWLGRTLHPVGVHTWVRHLRYDANLDGLIDVGQVCYWCPKARRG